MFASFRFVTLSTEVFVCVHISKTKVASQGYVISTKVKPNLLPIFNVAVMYDLSTFRPEWDIMETSI